VKVIATYADLSKAPIHWYLLGTTLLAVTSMIGAGAMMIFTRNDAAFLVFQVSLPVALISIYTRRGLRQLTDEMEASRSAQAEQSRRIRELEQAISELKTAH
jgi:hypothetical protein